MIYNPRIVIHLPFGKRSGSSSPHRVLANGVYEPFISGFRQLSDAIESWPAPLRRLVLAVGPVRALILTAMSTRYAVVVVFRTGEGWRSLLLLRALLGRDRKLVVLHFIDHPARATGPGALVDRIWRPIDRWATRRALLRAQVLSVRERTLYAATFGVQEARFCVIPYAWRMTDTPPTPASARDLVLAAGRALCDWPAVFAAAERGTWPVVVVCTSEDRELVDRLNAAGRATVMTELSPARMSELLLNAAVCVIALADSPISHGQIRLCNAVDAGAAVVASRISALDGYLVDGQTALLVSPGDPEALAAAVERLILDPGLRDQMAAAAFERAGTWTAETYLRAIAAFVRDGTAPDLPDSFVR